MRVSAVLAAAAIACVPQAASAQAVNDAQIASIVVTANQVDIDAGKLAASRAASAEVKKFAELMVSDHASVNRAADELARRLRLTPEDNPTSQALQSAGEKNRERLKRLSGAAFDRAYIDHEVAYHQQVLDALDKTLIPNASNAELEALLVKTRPAFVGHLQHARQVQAAIGRQ